MERHARDWQDHALCKGKTDLFFNTSKGDYRELEAKALCAQCPVREPCLDYAHTNRERHGVWGGEAQWERRKGRRPRAS